MHVHARAVVAVQRFRHEGHGLAVGIGNVVHAVLQGLDFVSLGNEGVELHTDLVLASGGHFVVVDFHDQAHFFQGVAHGGTDFVVVIDRRHREVAAFDARTVTFVAGFEVGVGVPGSLLGEDLEHRTGDVGLELHFVEDEELRLRADEYGVTDTGGLQVFLGALGDVARVALVALHGARLDDVADQDQGRLFGERVQDGSGVVRQQDHVGGFDAFPAGDGGTVEHLADFEEIVVQRVASRHGDVLLLALGIGEAQINPLHVIVFDQLVRLVRHAVLQEGLELGAFCVPQYRVMPAGILCQGNLPHKGASCVPVPGFGQSPETSGVSQARPAVREHFVHQLGAQYWCASPFWCAENFLSIFAQVLSNLRYNSAPFFVTSGPGLLYP
ncbi:MAG: hypothetical protein GAK43_01301 [Stenotrophomonas maltophilia]|nr:MAG: hypothetical protein GAK43_01301 [Stenotrophomonas maltophilia]